MDEMRNRTLRDVSTLIQVGMKGVDAYLSVADLEKYAIVADMPIEILGRIEDIHISVWNSGVLNEVIGIIAGHSVQHGRNRSEILPPPPPS